MDMVCDRAYQLLIPVPCIVRRIYINYTTSIPFGKDFFLHAIRWWQWWCRYDQREQFRTSTRLSACISRMYVDFCVVIAG